MRTILTVMISGIILRVQNIANTKRVYWFVAFLRFFVDHSFMFLNNELLLSGLLLGSLVFVVNIFLWMKLFMSSIHFSIYVSKCQRIMFPTTDAHVQIPAMMSRFTFCLINVVDIQYVIGISHGTNIAMIALIIKEKIRKIIYLA
ncbi:hypothetical protein GW750_07145 [bacterium]|nr:hypothetical protein [bacterium]